ncbi:MAG: hypothetical protein EXR71_10950 [Myxococcales bacterium]|nr:hypothetical protein [Myxococcales bacterium]
MSSESRLITERLRAACARMAHPPPVRDLGAPTEAEVTLRLQEACALWALCARLERAVATEV